MCLGHSYGPESATVVHNFAPMPLCCSVLLWEKLEKAKKSNFMLWSLPEVELSLIFAFFWIRCISTNLFFFTLPLFFPLSSYSFASLSNRLSFPNFSHSSFLSFLFILLHDSLPIVHCVDSCVFCRRISCDVDIFVRDDDTLTGFYHVV